LLGDVSVVSDIWFWDPIPNFRQRAFLDGCRPGRFGSKIGSEIRFGERPSPAAPRGMEK
jgi:hypothetical protein